MIRSSNQHTHTHTHTHTHHFCRRLPTLCAQKGQSGLRNGEKAGQVSSQLRSPEHAAGSLTTIPRMIHL